MATPKEMAPKMRNLINSIKVFITTRVFSRKNNKKRVQEFYQIVEKSKAGVVICDIDSDFEPSYMFSAANLAIKVLNLLESGSYEIPSYRRFVYNNVRKHSVYEDGDERKYGRHVYDEEFLEYLAPPSPWTSDVFYPVNCALTAVTNQNEEEVFELARQFATDGVGIGLTLLNEHPIEYATRLDILMASLQDTSKRSRSISVFIPSFHPEIKTVLTRAKAGQRWGFIRQGIIVFRSTNGSPDKFTYLEEYDYNTLVWLYQNGFSEFDSRTMGRVRGITNARTAIAGYIQREILYLFNGDAMREKFNDMPQSIKQKYPNGILVPNLCNEVILPISLDHPKFQLCVLMGIHWSKYKSLNQTDRERCVRYVVRILLHLWESIKSGNQKYVKHIDYSSNPIGIYFVGMFNDAETDVNRFKYSYIQMINFINAYVVEKDLVCDFYSTLPPGSEIQLSWFCSSPLQVYNNETLVLSHSVGNIKLIADKIHWQLYLDDVYKLQCWFGVHFMGSSINIQSKQDYETFKNMFVNNRINCMNILYYAQRITENNVCSKENNLACSSCEA